MGAEKIDEIIEWMRGRSEDGRMDRALWARAADAVEDAVAELRAECSRLRMVAEERSRLQDKQFPGLPALQGAWQLMGNELRRVDSAPHRRGLPARPLLKTTEHERTT